MWLLLLIDGNLFPTGQEELLETEWCSQYLEDLEGEDRGPTVWTQALLPGFLHPMLLYHTAQVRLVISKNWSVGHLFQDPLQSSKEPPYWTLWFSSGSVLQVPFRLKSTHLPLWAKTQLAERVSAVIQSSCSGRNTNITHAAWRWTLIQLTMSVFNFYFSTRTSIVGAGELAQLVNLLAVKLWGPKFDPRIPW